MEEEETLQGCWVPMWSIFRPMSSKGTWVQTPVPPYMLFSIKPMRLEATTCREGPRGATKELQIPPMAPRFLLVRRQVRDMASVS